MDLYEHIADDYDAVTGVDGRTNAAREMLAELRRRHPFDRVLDVACGNGMQAMMLAAMGVSVTGADLSRAMLDHARCRTRDAGLDIQWVHGPMQDLAGRVRGPFDAILCLGNSLPHLLDSHQLTRALAGFARLLAPDGVVVLQLLNYARVLDNQERIVGVTRKGDTEYVRFYDFLEDLVRFNVLKLTWLAGGCDHELSDTLLRPYTRQEIAAACRTADLGRIDCYAGGTFADFDEQNSDTLMVVARQGRE